MTKYVGIAITGKAGAGKTHFAHLIVNEMRRRGLPAKSYAFGDYVKNEVLELYGITKDSPGGRQKLIEHGMARRQQFSIDYWVNKLQDDWFYEGIPVIHDMRFLNEYWWAKQSGLLTVRLTATFLDRQTALHARGEDIAFADSQHPSETQLDEVTMDVEYWNPHGGVNQLNRLAFFLVDEFALTFEMSKPA